MSLQQNNSYDSFDANGMLDVFVIEAPTVHAGIDGQALKNIFDKTPEAEGAVITENGIPAGIIMRTVFYQKIGSLYGHSLYMNRPIKVLMDTAIMKVDVSENIAKIGIQAMNREHGKMYDYLVVYKNKSYIGVISIRMFLVELAKRNEAQISVLKNQQQRLISANEQEIILRKDIEAQSSSMRNLLDHADQGFLWFRSDLIIDKEYSYKCMDIFGKTIGGECYLNLLSAYFCSEKVAMFQSIFDSYFKNNSSVTDNVYLMLLPSDCVISGRNIHFKYRRIESGGHKAIMVILNDITEKVEMEEAIENDQNKQRLIIKAFSCQAQITQMVSEFHEVFHGGYKSFFAENIPFLDSLNELFRAVHTFKGDFAQYGFHSTSNELHQFEDSISSVLSRGSSANMDEVDQIMKQADPDKMLENDLNTISEVLGTDYFEQSEIISVPKSRLIQLQKWVQNSTDELGRASIINILQSLQLKNAKQYLHQYNDYLQYLSNRLMKNMPVYLVEGDDVEVDFDIYGSFFKSLVHVFRNIMDHGIESNEERLELEKPERGFVECLISRQENGFFTIRITDDGRGINLNRLKEKALEKRLYTTDELDKMNQNELYNLIFTDGLSSKNAADTLSGRGMGMPALRNACINLGGHMEIESEENKGTAFIITLPFIDITKGAF